LDDKQDYRIRRIIHHRVATFKHSTLSRHLRGAR
jgi:hypothetical protein